MKEILKNNIFNTEIVKIENDIPILEYLSKQYGTKFRLKYISNDTFMKLQNSDLTKNKKIGITHNHFIAGCSPRVYNSFKSDGGLKLSDINNGIIGSFVVEEKRVIYNPIGPAFNQEKDQYSCSKEFYTTMTMPEILAELLRKKRKLLIYKGFELKSKENENLRQEVDILEEIDKEEMMEYAINPEKGKKVFKKYISNLSTRRNV